MKRHRGLTVYVEGEQESLSWFKTKIEEKALIGGNESGVII